jgi:hypothetical protein
MAYRDSGDFFDDFTDEQWKLGKDRVRNRKNHFRDDPNRFIHNAKAWYQENFEPDFTCQHELRIGGTGDGPKWVCDPHRLATRPDCLVFSVGSAGDFMFENSVMKEIDTNCEIHTFAK